jgi:hypothetical protein
MAELPDNEVTPFINYLQKYFRLAKADVINIDHFLNFIFNFKFNSFCFILFMKFRFDFLKQFKSKKILEEIFEHHDKAYIPDEIVRYLDMNKESQM